ncbi:hypothetical protein DASC09_046320 [Saccharomycopsis crataegensis]|uniref:SAP domain-containing protein n=1 Tax=Saccharomycopsis crataegensis TaxID=43959 RepID=A0AAV5QRU2_9ASCO|nr:hypothetical protein DASC09_046320 [Saccharomycopsis crataegensis]
MSLKQLKKSELQQLAEGLGLGEIEGTKAIIEEQINVHFDLHPELEDHKGYAKYFGYRKRMGTPVKALRSSTISTPSKSFRASESDVSESDGSGSEDSGEEDEEEELVEGVKEEEEDNEEEEEEGEEEEEEEEETLEQEIEELPSSTEEAEVQLYNELKVKASEKFKALKAKSHECYETTIEEIIAKNSSLKSFFSTPATIYNLELLVEFYSVASYFLTFVPIKQLVPLSIEKSLPESINQIKVPHIVNFLKLEAVAVICFWFTISLFLPMVTSYYVNFNKSGAKYDPFSFFVSKGLLHYFFLGKAIGFEDIANDAMVSASKVSGVDVGLTVFDYFRDLIFEETIILRTALGLIPFFGNGVAVLISLYVAISS